MTLEEIAKKKEASTRAHVHYFLWNQLSRLLNKLALACVNTLINPSHKICFNIPIASLDAANIKK